MIILRNFGNDFNFPILNKAIRTLIPSFIIKALQKAFLVPIIILFMQES